MHSRGVYAREINHLMLQDGYKVKIILKQRRYRCTNISCRHEENETFSFVEKYKRSSFMTPYLIVEAFKDIDITCAKIAKRFNVSDTYVHEIFLKYVDIQRMRMPRILSIDEVYLNIDNDHRYCVILMDFESGDIIDVLPNRYKETLIDYFKAIPKEEKDKVEYVISDMYDGYIKIAERFFKNSRSIIDSFHIISGLISKINLYINDVKKRYQKRDRERSKELDEIENKTTKNRKDSDEVYLLKHYRWVLLKNQDDISHYQYRRIRYFGAYISTHEIEKRFLALDDDFTIIRDLKERYIAFNKEYIEKSEDEIKSGLDELIDYYEKSGKVIFEDFAQMLKRYKEMIIASFYTLPKVNANGRKEALYRRLSNGPMEGFNRKPKDIKRQARGHSNFKFVRNRILFATRDHAPILAIPKSKEEIATHNGKKRGSYNKLKRR